MLTWEESRFYNYIFVSNVLYFRIAVFYMVASQGNL